jgi:hypothetical protein
LGIEDGTAEGDKEGVSTSTLSYMAFLNKQQKLMERSDKQQNGDLEEESDESSNLSDKDKETPAQFAD